MVAYYPPLDRTLPPLLSTPYLVDEHTPFATDNELVKSKYTLPYVIPYACV